VTYAVEWSGPARRSIAQLPAKVATAAVEFVYSTLAANPQGAGQALHVELEGLHSARRGGHRILYRIDDDRRAVVIEAITHRSDVYRTR
jgi:mRNA interferase RelE/StbE